MLNSKLSVSALIVSASEKADEYLRDILVALNFSPISTAKSASEARRIQLENQYDIVIINTPLTDDFGIELATEISENSSAGVLLLVKTDLFEQVNIKVEEYGVLTLAKPGTRQSIQQAIMLTRSTYLRLAAFEKKATTLESKMKEIRIVNRAKWVLIERYKMSEQEAHKYIEKTAMDNCMKRGEIAANIIATYEN